MNTILTWLGNMLTSRTRSTPRTTVRLQLEGLEERMVPTVNYYGGGVLPSVQAQALFFGNQYSSNSTYYNDAGQLNNFTGFIVNSGYMDMLHNAGYGVGRGSSSNGVIANYSFNSAYYLTASQIQRDLQGLINAHSVAGQNNERLYVIYVEPGIAVQDSTGANSRTNFLGYHSAFYGSDGYGHSSVVHYAVVTFPGGAVRNATINGLTPVQQMTEVASHEISEAVTDPNGGLGYVGWYDYSRNGEIGDIVAGQAITYHGYVVQKEAGRNDQALVPPDYTGYYGATTSNALLSAQIKTHSTTDSADAVFASGMISDPLHV
jgi:hypothetical protein